MRLSGLVRRNAVLHRDVVAIEDADRTVTYGQFATEVDALAARLAELGVARGDRIAILGHNAIEYVAMYFAAAAIEAVTVPLNTRLGPAEIEYIVRDSTASLLLVGQSMVERSDALGKRLAGSDGAFTPVGDAMAGWYSIAVASAPHEARTSERPPSEDDVAIQMYTSGTTGSPKGALLTHRNVLALTTCWLHDMPLVPARSRFLQVTPLFHVGAVLMVASNMVAGSTLVLLPEFAPGPAAEALAERGITTALFVPAMIRWLLADPGMGDQTFPDLDLIAYGASPIPETLLRDAMATFGCDFVQGYGLTETAGVLTSLRPEDHRATGDVPARLQSAGRAVLCSEVRIVDEHDRPVPQGEAGELVARGSNVTPGYWNLPDATDEAMRGGWFHTGDVATMDAEGYITIVDRVKDMIIVGGENVYPREVEICLDTHEAVTESSVIGAPHDTWGEQVVALVVRSSGTEISDRELIAHARAGLARFKCPTRIDFVDELPRNAAGKVRKAELREPFWAGRDRRV